MFAYFVHTNRLHQKAILGLAKTFSRKRKANQCNKIHSVSYYTASSKGTRPLYILFFPIYNSKEMRVIFADWLIFLICFGQNSRTKIPALVKLGHCIWKTFQTAFKITTWLDSLLHYAVSTSCTRYTLRLSYLVCSLATRRWIMKSGLRR